MESKLLRKNETAVKELREGVTYQSRIAHTKVFDATEIPIPQTIQENAHLVNKQVIDSCKVFCDTEATFLYCDVDFVQLAAVCGSETFNQYTSPTKQISPLTFAVTETTSNGSTLIYQGKPVDSVPLEEGLQKFLSWIKMH